MQKTGFEGQVNNSRQRIGTRDATVSRSCRLLYARNISIAPGSIGNRRPGPVLSNKTRLNRNARSPSHRKLAGMREEGCSRRILWGACRRFTLHACVPVSIPAVCRWLGEPSNPGQIGHSSAPVLDRAPSDPT